MAFFSSLLELDLGEIEAGQRCTVRCRFPDGSARELTLTTVAESGKRSWFW